MDLKKIKEEQWSGLDKKSEVHLLSKPLSQTRQIKAEGSL